MANIYYQPWVNAGRPYQLVAYGRDLVDTFKRHGYVVYHYPDEPHLQARTPEDHTPYSRTGWPVASPYGHGHGIDLMPKAGLDARSLTKIARQVIADKDAGVPGTEGVKYINWTDEDNVVWQTSWKPDKATVRNSDAGHIHVSLRSDCLARALRTGGWDPIARSLSPSKPPEALMSKAVLYYDNAPGEPRGPRRIGFWTWSKPIVSDRELVDYQGMIDNGVIDAWKGQHPGCEKNFWPTRGESREFFGKPIEDVGALTDEQAQMIADVLAPLVGEGLADEVAVKAAAAVKADAAAMSYTTKPVVP